MSNSDPFQEVIHKGMDEAYTMGKTHGFVYGSMFGILAVLGCVWLVLWTNDLQVTFVRDGKVIDRSVCK